MKTLRFFFLLITIFLLPAASLLAQSFTLQTDISLPGVYNGILEWGDYDKDGDLDLFLAGQSSGISISKIYANNGSGVFTEQTGLDIWGTNTGAAGWADYDNDGDLDILLSGKHSTVGYLSQVFKNEEAETFTPQVEIAISELYNPKLDWGDYDNDGDLDILICGDNAREGLVTRIYRNMGDDSFSALDDTNLTGVKSGSVEWGDFDNDGDLDILLTGASGFYPTLNPVSKVYRNNGDNSFSEESGFNLPGVYSGSATWSDYDNDGFLDILLVGRGENGQPAIPVIYHNVEGNSFTLQTEIQLTQDGFAGQVAWGDYNNDSYPDILMCRTGETLLLKNNMGSSFAPVSDFSLANLWAGTIAWGDYDGDSDLDIILCGSESGQVVTQIYKNNYLPANTQPSSPENLQALVRGASVDFSWNPSSDTETSQAALSYALMIGNGVDEVDISSPMADISTGYRQLASRGNIQGNAWSIRGLDAGNYHWKVQSIDGIGTGSAFSGEGTFAVVTANEISPTDKQSLRPDTPGTTLTVSESPTADSRQWKYSLKSGGPYSYDISGANSITYTPDFTEFGSYYVACISEWDGSYVRSNEVCVDVQQFTPQSPFSLWGESYSSIRPGDYDNDGDLDILASGSIFKSAIFRNEGDLGFVEQTQINIDGVLKNDAVWNDYDGDGYLDFLLAGSSGVGGPSNTSTVHRNNGNNGFTPQADIVLEGVRYCSLLWEDTDNDGDPDILLSGMSSSEDLVFKLYRNDKNEQYTEMNPNIIPFSDGSMVGGDYDNDGFIDILHCGIDYSGNRVSKVYRNMGNNTFMEQKDIVLRNVIGAVDWGDYDNDGDLDILLVGEEIQQQVYVPVTLIYQNNGSNNFSELTQTKLSGMYDCDASWIDFDNDGDLDIFATGNSKLHGYISRFFINEGENLFSEYISGSLLDDVKGKAAWGDFDGDNDLDILLAGSSIIGGQINQLYLNQTTLTNSAPLTPGNPNAKGSSNGATFSWERSFDAETPGPGITYNIGISKSKVGSDLASPLSDLESGTRRIPQMGNVFHVSDYTISGLDTGRYYWRIQAIDPSFKGSAFTPVDSFSVLQAFTEKSIGLEAIEMTDIAPGDYDGDGQMDILISGDTSNTYPLTNVYRNDGAGGYTGVETGMTSIEYSTSAWCDYDNDGDLDIAISGSTTGSSADAATHLYKNMGDDSFTEQTGLDLEGALYANLDWGDLNNDGFQDMIVNGNLSLYKIRLNINDGNNSFSEDPDFDMARTAKGSIELGDYDNDMDLDILLTGELPDGSFISYIYRNNGDLQFTNIDAGMPGYAYSFSLWGDYDNDGDLDILISGVDSELSKYTKIFKNEGNDVFIESPAYIKGSAYSSAQWGDFDNDGDLDLLLSGSSRNTFASIYRNDGNDHFTELDFGHAHTYGKIAWLDYDNDRDLDILCSGGVDWEISTISFRNNGNWENDLPAVPGGLRADNYGYGAIFSWEASTDDKTPSPALSYNIRVGSVSGGQDIISPMSDLSNGKLYTHSMGNCQLNTGWRLDSLPVGTYFWSVQSVDNTYQGSMWAEEQSFQITSVNAVFEADTVCEGNETSFTNLSISSGDPITAWKWNFGDGVGTSELQHPSYEFEDSGTYMVELIASNSQSSDTLLYPVLVLPAPAADFSMENVCRGELSSIENLSTEGGSTIINWLWNFGDGNTSSEQDPESHGYLNAGEYQVSLTAIADNTCSSTLVRTVSLVDFPAAVIGVLPGYDSRFCSNDSTILAVPYHENYQYSWKREGIDLYAPEGNYIVVKGLAGEYTVELEDNVAGCKSGDSIQIEMLEAPASPVIISENYEEGGCLKELPVVLSVKTANHGLLYQWLQDGNPIAGATELSYTGFLSEGVYSLVAQNDEGCKEKSKELQIIYGEMPDKPQIHVGGPTVWYLACSNARATSYRWYLDQVLIPGAEEYIYVPGNKMGVYEVAVAEDESCYAFSDPVRIPLGTGIEDDIWKDLKIYPNPTPGLFTLEMNNPVMGELMIDIVNESGARIIHITFLKESSHFKTEIDLSSQPSAVYLIALILEEYRATRKLIVE